MRHRKGVELREGTGVNGRLGPFSYFGGRMLGPIYGFTFGGSITVYGIRRFNVWIEVTLFRKTFGIQVWRRGNEG